MSKKLKKFLNDAEKTESKIAELEEYLRNVRAAQKKEEDNEIVRAIRSTKLGGRDLLALLENIQAGNVTFQTTVNNENKTSEEAEMEDAIAKDALKAVCCDSQCSADPADGGRLFHSGICLCGAGSQGRACTGH